MVDLHCHSTFSDGACAPAALLRLAEARNLSAIALTDHDTVDGIEPFLTAGRTSPVEAIPGVEVACRGEGSLVMHIVGLWVNHRHPDLLALLSAARNGREQRNVAMVERLRGLGCPVELDDVRAVAGGGVLGRPHFAQVLVRQGHCRNQRDAFTQYLGRGKPAYVSRTLPPVEDVLAVLGAAGAASVWAHPLTSKAVTGAKLLRVADRLRGLGLDAIEVFYPDHTEHQTRTATEYARRLGLLISGGSDFHGDNVPGIGLGCGRGSLAVPDAIVGPLRQRALGKVTGRGS